MISALCFSFLICENGNNAMFISGHCEDSIICIFSSLNQACSGRNSIIIILLFLVLFVLYYLHVSPPFRHNHTPMTLSPASRLMGCSALGLTKLSVAHRKEAGPEP